LTIDSALPTLFPAGIEKNPLIALQSGPPTPVTAGRPAALQQHTREDFPEEFTGELFVTLYLKDEGGSTSPLQRRAKMAWKAPKIVEVPCGMEINMYVSATRK
jgi:coenzyme PQQ precursor peptide PqqA